MKEFLLLLHFTFGIFHFSFSQTAPGIEWQNTIGGSGSDAVTSLKQTPDGGFILGGLSFSSMSGDKTDYNCDSTSSSQDYWVVKVDSAGNIQWQKAFGGSYGDVPFSIVLTADGGYFIGGESVSPMSCDKTENYVGGGDYWVVKLDSSGNIQWQNTIGGDEWDHLSSVQQTTDGGYIIGGYSLSDISGDKTENSFSGLDYWVLKLNYQGTIQWQNTIGGTSPENLNSIQQTIDGGYILGGWSKSNVSGDKTENSNGYSDYWIVKLNSSGTIQWQNTIGGAGDDRLYSIKQTSDLGYILGGASTSNITGDKTENSLGDADIWVIKTDSLGNIQWQNTIGGSLFDAANSITQTDDGGYFLGGITHSNISGDKTENSYGGLDYWVIKLDSLGNINWQKTIGGNLDDYFYSLEQTSDEGFILGGESLSNISGIKTENSVGGSDYWILKLYPDSTTGLSPNPSPQERGVVIFPNPTKNEITISIPPLWGGQVGLTVFDVMGKQVLSQSITNLNSQIINLKSFTNGVYFMQLQSGSKVSRAKFVKQ